MSASIMIGLLHVSLNTGGISNEMFFEVCVKWGNFQNIGKEFSTLGLTLVVLLSLTKVNLYNKNGLAILKSSKIILRFKGQLKARGGNETVYSENVSMAHTVTEENLIITRDKNIYQKTIYIKRGNLGKDIKSILNAVSFKLLWVKPKDTIVYLYFYLRKSLNLVSYNLLGSSTYVQECSRLHGGKIREKANALSNVKNTSSYMSIGRYVAKKPRVKHMGQKLNSQCLEENFLDFKLNKTIFALIVKNHF